MFDEVKVKADKDKVDDGVSLPSYQRLGAFDSLIGENKISFQYALCIDSLSLWLKPKQSLCLNG